ncbi:MAG: NAD(P)/FAD-dependent oxidoreductase [Oleiphilaceae bacterium]|nr:NAD(P)/FAD-dependent oxidoreductase [Oleiphilaceae bacterium]
MNAALKTSTVNVNDSASRTQQLDVLIIGAGISGIGMACTLQRQRPNDQFAIIESRANIGGTWDLFRYPGIRSDSDMYTFAYSFKPWKHKEYIGTGERIRDYLNDLVDEQNLRSKIRFNQRVVKADWQSDKARWCVTVLPEQGDAYTIEARFLVTCTGYYNYEKGYMPEFEGVEDFTGDIVHPQHWPEQLDYEGKQVVVIGSGATAVTVVPAMAEKAAHVTMLQRSPTYIVSVPSEDGLFSVLSKILPLRVTNRIMRAKYVTIQQLLFLLSQRFPNFVRKLIRFQNRKALAGAANVDEHFNPRYKPWDQRMCMVPDEDLFAAMREGRASVVTDHIERFTENGIQLRSGQHLEADIVVPATGLEIQYWGGMDIRIDGARVEASKLTNYKGMMFSQVPNLVTIFGYTSAPWTLKAELTYGYVNKLLDYMQQQGHRMVFPYQHGKMEQVDLVNLNSSYVQRAKGKIPMQGTTYPWRNKDFYWKDIFAIKHSELVDGVLRFDDAQPLKRFHQTEPAREVV